jgi:hypothetical protein
MGILYAWAVADFISIIIAISFLIRETKSLKKKHKQELEKEDEYTYNYWNNSLELFATVENKE